MPRPDVPFSKRLISWPAEAAAVSGWLGVCRRMPVEKASACGAAIAGRIGPRIPYSKRALQNMQLALPHLSATERNALLREMWGNLGRLGAEYAHLAELSDPNAGYVTVEGLHHLREAQDSQRPIIAVSAHLANFEVMNVMLSRLVPDYLAIVRAPNNPKVVEPLDRLRRVGGGATAPKGHMGVKEAMRTLSRRGLVGILADQRMSDGLDVPFFNHVAGTPAGPAQLALRYEAVLLPVRMIRRAGVQFTMRIEAPLNAPSTTPADTKAQRLAIVEAMNRRFETWIRENPQDWLWLHRRWPKPVYNSLPRA